MPESFSDSKYQAWYKALKLDITSRQTVERNIAAKPHILEVWSFNNSAHIKKIACLSARLVIYSLCSCRPFYFSFFC